MTESLIEDLQKMIEDRTKDSNLFRILKNTSKHPSIKRTTFRNDYWNDEVILPEPFMILIYSKRNDNNSDKFYKIFAFCRNPCSNEIYFVNRFSNHNPSSSFLQGRLGLKDIRHYEEVALE